MIWLRFIRFGRSIVRALGLQESSGIMVFLVVAGVVAVLLVLLAVFWSRSPRVDIKAFPRIYKEETVSLLLAARVEDRK